MKQFVRSVATSGAALKMPLYYTALGAGLILATIWLSNWHYTPLLLRVVGALIGCMVLGCVTHKLVHYGHVAVKLMKLKQSRKRQYGY